MALPEYQWLRDELESAEGKERVRKAVELGKLARELAMTTAQLSIAWCLVNPNVSTVILGATNAAQLRENLGALRILPELRQGVVERIESIVANKPAAPQRY